MDPNSLPGILEPRTLLLFALFVTPGWLMRLFWRRYLAAEPEPFGSEILATVSLSLLSTAVSFLPVALALELAPSWGPLWALLWLLLAVAIVPAVAAYAYVSHRTGTSPNLTELLLGPKLPGADDEEPDGATPVAPVPTAFDAVFGSGGRFVVRFAGPGEEARYGYFGDNSYSSPFPNEQQLYLEELLATDDGGRPTGREIDPRLRSRGVILRMPEQSILEIERLPTDPAMPGEPHPLERRFATKGGEVPDGKERRGGEEEAPGRGG